MSRIIFAFIIFLLSLPAISSSINPAEELEHNSFIEQGAPFYGLEGYIELAVDFYQQVLTSQHIYNMKLQEQGYEVKCDTLKIEKSFIQALFDYRELPGQEWETDKSLFSDQSQLKQDYFRNKNKRTAAKTFNGNLTIWAEDWILKFQRAFIDPNKKLKFQELLSRALKINLQEFNNLQQILVSITSYKMINSELEKSSTHILRKILNTTHDENDLKLYNLINKIIMANYENIMLSTFPIIKNIYLQYLDCIKNGFEIEKPVFPISGIELMKIEEADLR